MVRLKGAGHQFNSRSLIGVSLYPCIASKFDYAISQSKIRFFQQSISAVVCVFAISILLMLSNFSFSEEMIMTSILLAHKCE
jgi:hypothetical protein